MNLDEKQKFLVNFAFIVTFLFIIYFSINFAFSYLMPFLIGLIIAYFVQKPAEFIYKKTKIKKQICAAVLSVLTYVVFLILLILLVWLVVNNVDLLIEYLSGIGNFIEKLADTINQFINEFSKHFDFKPAFENALSGTINDLVTKMVSLVSSFVTTTIKNTPKFFVSSIVTIVATCYISKDYDRLKCFFKGVISVNLYKNIVTIKKNFTDSILKFVFGYLKIAAITFFELLTAFFILRIEHFFISSLLISFIDLLPVLGVGTILLPWSAILFLQGNYQLGLKIILVYVIVGIVRNFLEPKIIGNQIGINPLFTLVSMFLGLKLAGVMGMIIFPIVLILVYTFYRDKFSTT